jgi:hypothetical protein
VADKLDLGEPGAQATLLDYIGAVDTLVVRRDALEARIAELVPGSSWATRSPGCAVCVGSTRCRRSHCGTRHPGITHQRVEVVAQRIAGARDLLRPSDVGARSACTSTARSAAEMLSGFWIIRWNAR